ncbi:MAG: hypothetical protein AAGI48_13510 [Verrucomicrobiota bacterium]
MDKELYRKAVTSFENSFSISKSDAECVINKDFSDACEHDLVSAQGVLLGCKGDDFLAAKLHLMEVSIVSESEMVRANSVLLLASVFRSGKAQEENASKLSQWRELLFNDRSEIVRRNASVLLFKKKNPN